MRSFRKRKYDYVYANFKNVLTICWYFLASNFPLTMLYCIRVSSVTTRSYLSTTTSNLLTSLLVCCLLLDVSSSWFLWYEKGLGGNITHLLDVTCGCPLFPSSPRVFRMLSKIAVSSGLTYFVTQKLG